MNKRFSENVKINLFYCFGTENTHFTFKDRHKNLVLYLYCLSIWVFGHGFMFPSSQGVCRTKQIPYDLTVESANGLV